MHEGWKLLYLILYLSKIDGIEVKVKFRPKYINRGNVLGGLLPIMPREVDSEVFAHYLGVRFFVRK